MKTKKEENTGSSLPPLFGVSNEVLEAFISKYEYRIFYSEEDSGYIATVAELPGLSGFGETAEEALEEVKIAVAAALDYMFEKNKEFPQPRVNKGYSGKFIVRMSPILHHRLVQEAETNNVSLNSLVSNILGLHIYGK